MPTEIFHDLVIRRPIISLPEEGTTDDTETAVVGDGLVMVITVKNPIGDPEPSAPDLGEDLNLTDSTELEDQSDADTTRTMQFTYEMPAEWTFGNPVRNADAATPWPALPDNVWSLVYKDQRDEAQGYTTQIYFTES